MATVGVKGLMASQYCQISSVLGTEVHCHHTTEKQSAATVYKLSGLGRDSLVTCLASSCVSLKLPVLPRENFFNKSPTMVTFQKMPFSSTTITNTNSPQASIIKRWIIGSLSLLLLMTPALTLEAHDLDLDSHDHGLGTTGLVQGSNSRHTP